MASEHLSSEAKELITIQLGNGAHLLHGDAHELHNLNFLTWAKVSQVVSILYPNFKKLGDSRKFRRQQRVGRVLDALDDMVYIGGNIHAKSACTLLLIIDGLKT